MATTRIKLTSIPGVERDPARDFRDDGSSFKAYLYKGVVPFTYCSWRDEIFLSVRFDIAGIPYSTYKNWKEGDEMNGVYRNSYNKERFQEILENCYHHIMSTRR